MLRCLCKICGLTRPEDTLLCGELEVDFTGFIFAAKSPRRVTPEFVASLPDGPCRRVGVFAGAGVDEVLRIMDAARLDLAQLHGGEDATFCRAVGPERVIKVLWPDSLTRPELEMELARFAPAAAYFLFDAGATKTGGSGKSLNWAAFRDLPTPRPWFLAGGLGPKTLLQAMAVCAPDGVDLNSALETSHGVKDHKRVREAVARLRGITT